MSETQNWLLGAPGDAAPTTLAAYMQQGGYTALRQALASNAPEQVRSEVGAARLRGRGGAGVLTAEKLTLVAHSDDPTRYLICNAYDADERSRNSATLLERLPHLVIEGMALAGYAAGIHEAFLYLRSTRAEAAAAAHTALREAQEQGFLGHDILGTGFDFAITVAGAERGFMGGEESSLIELLKGRPLLAQQRPPYPTSGGLGGHPTAVQNVETLANLPHILARGARAFAALGTEGSSGTKLLTVISPGALAGDARVIEVPMGTSIRQALRQATVDVDDANTRAVVVGGREGGVLPLSQLDTPIDFETLEQAGVIIGSSIIEALAHDTCMVHWSMGVSGYLAEASCGKCVPCRVGVKRIASTLEGIASGLGTRDDLSLLDEFAHYVADGSLCGYGVNAVNPLATALRYFGADFTAHIEGHCPTGTCEPVRAHRYVTKHVL